MHRVELLVSVPYDAATGVADSVDVGLLIANAIRTRGSAATPPLVVHELHVTGEDA